MWVAALRADLPDLAVRWVAEERTLLTLACASTVEGGCFFSRRLLGVLFCFWVGSLLGGLGSVSPGLASCRRER